MGSDSKRAKSASATKTATNRAASQMSQSSARGSRCIQRPSITPDRGQDVGVMQGALLDQIDGPAEQGFEARLQFKIMGPRLPGRTRLELHDQINVAALRIEVVLPGCRSEDLEASNAKLMAQTGQNYTLVFSINSMNAP